MIRNPAQIVYVKRFRKKWREKHPPLIGQPAERKVSSPYVKVNFDSQEQSKREWPQMVRPKKKKEKERDHHHLSFHESSSSSSSFMNSPLYHHPHSH